MNSLSDKQKAEEAFSSLLTIAADERDPRARAEKLHKLQFEEGQDIFACNWSTIHRAARLGDVRGIKFFLDEQRVPVDVVDTSGDTALNIASWNGHLKVCEELIRHFCNINLRNSKGWSPSHSAASQNRAETIRLLAKHGASVSSKTVAGIQPIHLAAATNSVDVIRTLHELFVEEEKTTGKPVIGLNAANSLGVRAVHIAAQQGNLEAIECLHELGADIEALDYSGESPAHKAARFFQVGVLEFLQSKGVDMSVPNLEQDTCVDLANDNSRFSRSYG